MICRQRITFLFRMIASFLQQGEVSHSAEFL